MTPAGSQESADWPAALDRVASEMGTLQRSAHTMAVQLAEAEARVAGLNICCTARERHGTTTAKRLEARALLTATCLEPTSI